MSEKPGSTIGFERRFNSFAAIDDEGEFMHAEACAISFTSPTEASKTYRSTASSSSRGISANKGG
jgi:hypothetical protein